MSPAALTWEMGMIITLSLGAGQRATGPCWERSRAFPAWDWLPIRLMQLVAAFQRQGGQTRLGTRLIRSIANWHLIIASRQHMTVYLLAVLSPSFREEGCGPGRR